jgi:hypothetical protein
MYIMRGSAGVVGVSSQMTPMRCVIVVLVQVTSAASKVTTSEAEA